MRYAPLLLALLISACAGKAEPQARYALPLAAPAEAGDKQGPVLRINRPASAQGLDSTQIQVEKPDGKLSQVENAGWVEPLPALVADALRSRLQRSAQLGPVLGADASANADAALKLTLERFTVEYTDSMAEAPQAHIRLSYTLTRQPEGALLASGTLEERQEAAENRLEALMQAFGAGLDSMSAKLETEIAQELTSQP